ncbi:hypothetical protein MNB_SM-6-1126 [hydrothermal vent metagenome]|uniref:Lipoprotein LPP20-like domain-containing protein n=1 Tax=hydrothermal vent metagenome TaxID=652676 RepID=A0A1W1BVQ2_9ZZZZ
MRKFFYFLMSVILLLTGCGASKQMVVVAPKATPAWYTNPPLSNERELYAIGDGKEKQEAISNALTQLLSTLSVSISSKYSAKSVVREGTYHSSSDATYINETQSEVKKIRVTNYELLQAKKLGFKHYAVLVKVDKEKFFDSLKKDLTQQFALIAAEEKNIKAKNALQQLSFYKHSLAHLSDMQNRLAVMSVLKPDFDEHPFLKKYEYLKKRYNVLLHSISFWVDAKYKAFIPVIAKGLTQEQFIVAKTRSKNHFSVYIYANIERAEAYGIMLARANITIKTKDAVGNEIATNSINLTGRSSQSYAIAKQDLVKRLNRLVEREGIAKVLNLDI